MIRLDRFPNVMKHTYIPLRNRFDLAWLGLGVLHSIIQNINHMEFVDLTRRLKGMQSTEKEMQTNTKRNEIKDVRIFFISWNEILVRHTMHNALHMLSNSHQQVSLSSFFFHWIFILYSSLWLNLCSFWNLAHMEKEEKNGLLKIPFDNPMKNVAVGFFSFFVWMLLLVSF